MHSYDHKTDIVNVLIIGSGGAGLRSAIEAREAGLKVSVLGKRVKIDSHTVLAAGGINAAFGNVDAEDSWEQHFADTYIEGYGLGDPILIEKMAKLAPEIVQEIDHWGANFAKLSNGSLDQRFFGAHTYRRTCYSGDYTGKSILKALLQRAENLKIPIHENQYVTQLLVTNNTCFGAMTFNMDTLRRTVYLADAIVLATGGHTRIWQKSSSRKHENTGDGLYLGLKAGCKLIDMEMVQFHPTGMTEPLESIGKLVTEAVRGEGGKLFNSNGERFMHKYDPVRMELSTRDRIAIANYKEIKEGRGTKSGGVFLDISHKEKQFIIEKLPEVYKQFIELQMLDISKNAMEVCPTAHYSMGGIATKTIDHDTDVEGLFAAGEVAGGLHGANRLGGNSLSEILIFGKLAGEAAAKRSKNLREHPRCQEAIQNAHHEINSLIKNGSEIASNINNELRDIMWKRCGVIRDEEGLIEGLESIKSIKSKARNVEVIINNHSSHDLVNIFELKSSIMSAEASLISALARKESRGSHQRNDFQSINSLYNLNYLISLDQGDRLQISSHKYPTISEDLKKIITTTQEVVDFKNKLIE